MQAPDGIPLAETVRISVGQPYDMMRWGPRETQALEGEIDTRIQVIGLDESELCRVEVRARWLDVMDDPWHRRAPEVTTDPETDLRWIGTLEGLTLDANGDLDVDLGAIKLLSPPRIATVTFRASSNEGHGKLWFAGGDYLEGPGASLTAPIVVPTGVAIDFHSWEPDSFWTGRVEDIGHGGVHKFHAYVREVLEVDLVRHVDVRIRHADDGCWKGPGTPSWHYALVPADEYEPPDFSSSDHPWMRGLMRTGHMGQRAVSPIQGYHHVDEDGIRVFRHVPVGEYIVEVWHSMSPREPIGAVRVLVEVDGDGLIVVGE